MVADNGTLRMRPTNQTPRARPSPAAINLPTPKPNQTTIHESPARMMKMTCLLTVVGLVVILLGLQVLDLVALSAQIAAFLTSVEHWVFNPATGIFTVGYYEGVYFLKRVCGKHIMNCRPYA